MCVYVCSLIITNCDVGIPSYSRVKEDGTSQMSSNFAKNAAQMSEPQFKVIFALNAQAPRTMPLPLRSFHDLVYLIPVFVPNLFSIKFQDNPSLYLIPSSLFHTNYFVLLLRIHLFLNAPSFSPSALVYFKAQFCFLT